MIWLGVQCYKNSNIQVKTQESVLESQGSNEGEISNDELLKNSYLAKHVLEAKVIFDKVVENWVL